MDAKKLDGFTPLSSSTDGVKVDLGSILVALRQCSKDRK